MKVGKYDAYLWIRELKKHGFDKFFFEDLPEGLKSKSLLIKASHEKFIRKTGTGRHYDTRTLTRNNSATAAQHEINPAALNLSHSNQRIR